MKHVITLLEASLQVMAINEPINRREGNTAQADLEAETAAEIRHALTLLADEKPRDTVGDTKRFRKDLDGVLQRLKISSDPKNPHQYARSSRERSLAVTKLQEAIMWLGMDLKAINEESPSEETANPYPQSYNPESPVIEPTADGLKL